MHHVQVQKYITTVKSTDDECFSCNEKNIFFHITDVQKIEKIITVIIMMANKQSYLTFPSLLRAIKTAKRFGVDNLLETGAV